MINWFKKLLQKNKEVWHYECENGHKWESLHSPRGTHVFGIEGQTRCPECGTPICISSVYINGESVGRGAMHVAFKSK